jgi:hypothetical protein
MADHISFKAMEQFVQEHKGCNDTDVYVQVVSCIHESGFLRCKKCTRIAAWTSQDPECLHIHELEMILKEV